MAINALHQVVQDEKVPLIGLNYWKLSSHFWKLTSNSSHNGNEPFMLLISKEESDELQTALTQFLKTE
jgi:hypothetical protein